MTSRRYFAGGILLAAVTVLAGCASSGGESKWGTQAVVQIHEGLTLTSVTRVSASSAIGRGNVALRVGLENKFSRPIKAVEGVFTFTDSSGAVVGELTWPARDVNLGRGVSELTGGIAWSPRSLYSRYTEAEIKSAVASRLDMAESLAARQNPPGCVGCQSPAQRVAELKSNRAARERAAEQDIRRTIEAERVIDRVFRDGVLYATFHPTSVTFADGKYLKTTVSQWQHERRSGGVGRVLVKSEVGGPGRVSP